MSLAHNTDYLGDARKRLLEQYKGLPRFDALLQSFMQECQALEDAAWAVYVDRELQSGLAFGDVLDKLGKLVGQTRQGFSDTVYALLVQARIATNRSDGLRATLIRIATLLAPNTTIEVREYRGAVVVTALAPVTVPPTAIAQQFLERAQLGGVRMTFVYLEQALSATVIGGYKFNASAITAPTTAQCPGYHATGTSDPHYIAGGDTAGALTADGGSSL